MRLKHRVTYIQILAFLHTKSAIYYLFSHGTFRSLLGFFWLGFPGLICLVVVWFSVGFVFLLFMAGLTGLLECIHNLLFTFLFLRFIYSFNIFICRYICLTVYYIVYCIICYIVLTQLCFIFYFSCNKWINQSNVHRPTFHASKILSWNQ